MYLLLILATALGRSLSQAPGDGSSYCFQENIDSVSNPFFATRPVYAANVRPLMDSRDYMTLLIGEDAVWQHVDADSNNMQGVATHVSCNPPSKTNYIHSFSASWIVSIIIYPVE